MNIKIQAIQINQINIYNFSAFPADRIGTLISELNVHYGKINNYLEAEVSGEKLNIEVIDSLAKLKEIDRLAPYRLDDNPNSGDFRLGVELLESVIALLKTDAGHVATKNNILNLGWSLLNRLYRFSFDGLVESALLYNWLKGRKLIRIHRIDNWGSCYQEFKSDRIEFKPSDEDLNKFFESNQQKIFEYMVFEMDRSKEEVDPFSNYQAADFYHYHQTLSGFKI